MNDGLLHLGFVALFLVFFGVRGYYFRRAQRLRGAVTYIEGRLHRALRLVGGVPLAALVLIVATRVRREEALMLRTFGDAYERYIQRTGRFLPRLRVS